MILPCQPDRNMNENPFHILKWGIPSAQERKARSGTEGCCKQEPKIPRSARRSFTAPCSPQNLMLSCMHHSCACQRWNEGQAFSPCHFTKHLEKTQRLVQTKTWAGAIRFSCFLPCLAAAGTGISIQLLAAVAWKAQEWGFVSSCSCCSTCCSTATMSGAPTATRKRRPVHSWSGINFTARFHICISLAIYTKASISPMFAHSSIMTAFVTSENIGI